MRGGSGGSGGRGRPQAESEELGPLSLAAAATPSAASSALAGAAGAAESPTLLRVIKEVDLRGDERRRAEALREAEVLKALTHPNIVAYHEALLMDSLLCIVMEYADGGDLAGAIARRKSSGRRFFEREAMSVLVQLALALQYIHERRILHRDLKSKNAFLTKSGVVKLGDFGIAKVFDASGAFTETQIGTPYYLAPEMCANQPYAYPADIWCLGIVFYELMALEVPFSAPSVPALAHKICNVDPQPVQGLYSSESKALLGCMLAKRPEERPSSIEILQLPHVRRSAAALLVVSNSAAAAGSTPLGLAEVSSVASAGSLRHSGHSVEPEACAAGIGSGRPGRAAGGDPSALADLDLDELLGPAEESLPSNLAVPDAADSMPLSPTRGAEAAKFHSSLQKVLDSRVSCDSLLHELEQELNLR